MMILSQKGNAIVNTQCTPTIFITCDPAIKIKASRTDTYGSITLGEYESMEEAKKILEKIILNTSYNSQTFIMPPVKEARELISP